MSLTEVIYLRTDKPTKDALVLVAEEERRTLSGLCDFILRTWLEERDQPDRTLVDTPASYVAETEPA